MLCLSSKVKPHGAACSLPSIDLVGLPPRQPACADELYEVCHRSWYAWTEDMVGVEEIVCNTVVSLHAVEQ